MDYQTFEKVRLKVQLLFTLIVNHDQDVSCLKLLFIAFGVPVFL